MLNVSRLNPQQVYLILLGLLSVAATVSISTGAVSITWSDLLGANSDPMFWNVLVSLRLPRVALAILVGMSLAVSGAVMQGLFRNPLADPGLIGITSGAALFAGLFILFFEGLAGGFWGLYGLSLLAFLGAIVTSFVVFKISKRGGQVSVLVLLLAGVAVNALAGAGTGLLTYLSNDEQLRSLTFWTLGSLGRALWPTVLMCATLMIPTLFLLFLSGRELNIMQLGEEEAQHLGVDCARVKKRVVVLTSICIGAAVAACGLIGFVGLMVPHLVRLMIGPDHRVLIPCSALLGAILLLSADTVSRLVIAPAELPVGILTSLLGGPFFFWLLHRQLQGTAL